MTRFYSDTRRAVGGRLCVAAVVSLAPLAAVGAPLTVTETVMDGLANPRGLAFGPNGALFVAEAGRGGTGPRVEVTTGPARYGRTGAVSRLRGGTQTRVVSGLPSLAPAGGAGAEAAGAQGLAFDGEGDLHAAIGLGAGPDARAELASTPGADLLGHVVELGDGSPRPIADLAAFEAANDPLGDGIDSNPYGLAEVAGGFAATDAGGNTLLGVDATGAITVEAAFADRPNPLPFGPPVYESVPTGAAAADGDVLVGELTGFPFPEGAARIRRVTPGGGTALFADGATNLIDLAVGPGGTVYALEHDDNGLATEGGSGALLTVGADGTLTTVLAGLTSPTGVAVAASGDVFVTDNGNAPGDGRVVRIAPVSLPAVFPAMAVALAGLFGLRRRTGRAV